MARCQRVAPETVPPSVFEKKDRRSIGKRADFSARFFVTAVAMAAV
jgi:hypothetical protein